MKILALGAMLLALSACQTTRFVTRSCLTPAQLEELKKQAPPSVREKLTGKADEDVKILAGNLIRRRAYEGLLLDTLSVCAS